MPEANSSTITKSNAPKPLPSQKRLHEVLCYQRDTGVFLWKPTSDRNRLWNARYAGTMAGTQTTQGYWRIKVDGTAYTAHRLAWLYVYGNCPPELDHKNMDKRDNRIENLRPATRQQNQQNRPHNKQNKTGRKGVSWAVRQKQWRASITINGTRKYLGYFRSTEDAATAYQRAAAAFFGEFHNPS